MSTELVLTNGASIPILAAPKPLTITPISIEQHKERLNFLELIIKENLIEGVHYGYMDFQLDQQGKPKKGAKPCCSKPGAEQICLIFQLGVIYSVTRTDLPGGHREYEVLSTFTHTPTGIQVGQGLGCCSTMESKYRYRFGERKCPTCLKEGIRKSKSGRNGQPPGFYCWEKLGGCGATFEHDDPSITEQVAGKVENENPADQFNTVLKMARKRSHVDGALSTTGASQFMTQDLDEDPDASPSAPEPKTGKANRDNQGPPPGFYGGEPETLRGGTHQAVASNQTAAKRAPRKAPESAKVEDVSQEELPEPLPNPWLHKIECVKGVSSLEKGKYLFEVSEQWIFKYTSNEFRNRLTPADLSNIAHAYRRPEMKEDAMKQVAAQIAEEDGQGSDDEDYNSREVA